MINADTRLGAAHRSRQPQSVTGLLPDAEVEGITLRDPDGLEIVLMWIGEKVPATGPPAWLYWYH
jgi:hypothetical protein